MGTDTSALELIAEISIGLIGFAGIVAVLSRSRLPPAVRSFRITALMMNGVLALIGALLPIIFLKYAVSPQVAWIAAAGVLVLMWSVVVLWAARVTASLIRNSEIPRNLTYVVLTLAAFVWLYLLYGTLFNVEALPAIYLVVLVSSIVLSLFHFVMLVLSVQSDDN